MVQRVLSFLSWLRGAVRETLEAPRLVPVRIHAEPRQMARHSRRPLRRRTFDS